MTERADYDRQLAEHIGTGSWERPAYPMTVEHEPPPEDLRSALLGIDEELRRLFVAPHQVEDHGLAHAWVRARAALWPAGSRSRS